MNEQNEKIMMADALGPGEGPTPLDIEKARAKGKRLVYTLNPGMVFNPLINYPRNAPCPCGSLIKFKKCHYGKIERAVPIEQTEGVKEQVKLTKEARKKL